MPHSLRILKKPFLLFIQTLIGTDEAVPLCSLLEIAKKHNRKIVFFPLVFFLTFWIRKMRNLNTYLTQSFLSIFFSFVGPHLPHPFSLSLQPLLGLCRRRLHKKDSNVRRKKKFCLSLVCASVRFVVCTWGRGRFACTNLNSLQYLLFDPSIGQGVGLDVSDIDGLIG